MANYTTAQINFTFDYDGVTDLVSIDINRGPVFYQGAGNLHSMFASTPKNATNVSINSQMGDLINNKQISTTATISGAWLEVNIPAGLLAGSFTVFATLQY
jgi:hypothetical protein